MAEYSSGPYFISRRRGGSGGRRRGAGLLIVVLLLLTAGICLLVVLLPTTSSETSTKPESGGATSTFYFLATSEATDRASATDGALGTAARGGAGYVFNDGSYKIIAAVYRREADAKALAEVNDGAFCIKYELNYGALEKADRAAVSYLTGEWFDEIFNAADGLDRGNVVESEADRTAQIACSKLMRRADKVKSAALRRALEKAGEYSVPTGRSLISYLRYVIVRALTLVGDACAAV